MAQPPDDRRPMPWETPNDQPGADEPTVPWTPPDAPPPTPDAPPPTPDASPPTPDAPPLTPDAPPPTGEAAPESPLISWTPSGDAAAAGAAGAAGAGTPAGVPGSPIAGWESPDAGAPAAPVTGYVVAGVGSRLVAWFLDLLLLGFLLGLVFLLLSAVAPSVAQDASTINIVTAILIVGMSFLYFVGFWTSGSGATLGMRLLALRVVAQEGGTLDIGPAIIRWLALAYWATLLGLVPVLAVFGNWAYTIWSIVLLLTTAMSPVNQGLHDRWARSAVIRRADARTNPILIGCLILALIGVLLFIVLPVMAFMSITPEMWEEILSQVGDSI